METNQNSQKTFKGKAFGSYLYHDEEWNGEQTNNSPESNSSKFAFSPGKKVIPSEFKKWDIDWREEELPQQSPYAAQIGDELVYYRQAHAAFISYNSEKMRKRGGGIYSEKVVNGMMGFVAYQQYPDLDAAVLVRLQDIKYFDCYALELTVVVKDWVSGEETGPTFKIVCPWLAKNFPFDFLIHREIHDKSCRENNWKGGDRFACLLNRKWTFGRINKVEPLEAKFPNSRFASLHVQWETEAVQTRVSPWDIQPADSKMTASVENFEQWRYQPMVADWPPKGDQTDQCAKLSKLLDTVVGMKVIAAPVLEFYEKIKSQTILIPAHYYVSPPTIQARLDNRYYRRVDALRFDINLMMSMTEIWHFREGDMVKVRNSRIFRDLLLEMTYNPNMMNIAEIYSELDKKHSSIISNKGGAASVNHEKRRRDNVTWFTFKDENGEIVNCIVPIEHEIAALNGLESTCPYIPLQRRGN